MTNLLPFTYTIVGKTETKGTIHPNISQVYKVGKVVWTSLLGKSNKELQIDALVNSAKFNTYVETAREDFIKNHADFNLYPKFDTKDWE